MLFKVLFVFLTIQFVSSSSMNLSFIHKCNQDDPHLNDCIIQNGNIAMKTIFNGIPSLHISLKPFKLYTIKGKLGPTVDLKYNGYAYLSNDIQLYYANIDPKNQEFQLGLNFTKLLLNGNLTLNGTLENKKFISKTTANFTYVDTSYQYNATYITYSKNNTVYGRVSNSTTTTKYKNFNYTFYNSQFSNKLTSNQLNILQGEINSNIESVITNGTLYNGNREISFVFNEILGLIPLNQIFT